MWGVLAAAGIVGALVVFTNVEKSDEPVVKPALEKVKLAWLVRKRHLTLPQAEDGLALSRRLHERDLERRFERVVRRLKSH